MAEVLSHQLVLVQIMIFLRQNLTASALLGQDPADAEMLQEARLVGGRKANSGSYLPALQPGFAFRMFRKKDHPLWFNNLLRCLEVDMGGDLK